MNLDNALSGCGNCRFFVQTRTDKANVIGDCYLNPPVVSFEDENVRVFTRPEVQNDDFCGSYHQM